LLKPYHSYMMRLLRATKEDCSWDQSKVGPILRKWTSEGRLIESIDLSKATDRFPASLQWILISTLFPHLSGHKEAFFEFVLQPKVDYRDTDGSLNETKYAVGSPMGIYTSWASFALCHHLLVRVAGHRVRVRTRGKYLILGDDIVISDRELASSYKKVLEDLEIPWNSKDSFVSNQHESIAEFAKRLFINGRDLSPLPLRLLEGNLTMEASWLIKCKEIGHHFWLDEDSYPGNSNRLELLLLSGYVFRKIQNTIEPLNDNRLSVYSSELLVESLRDFFETEVSEFCDRQHNISTLKSERVKIVKSFIKMIKGKKTPWRPVSRDQQLIHILSSWSSWAECLDKDEGRFLEMLINNPYMRNSDYSKQRRSEDFKSFSDILEAYSNRPRPIKARDYDVIRRRVDLKRMGTIVSALSSKKGLIPFPEEDLLKLKQLFLNR
jgi:hypothetical protein